MANNILRMIKGIGKENTMKTFKKICRMKQTTLKAWLEKQLKSRYSSVVNGDGFLYAKGTDVLLTAHMDTVHKEVCRDIKVVKKAGQTILSSPQGIGGDDRCGIWLILQVLWHTSYRPSILFCEDEEIGGVGSSKFTDTKYIEDFSELKYLIELDRANADDAVFYSCANQEFKEYVESFGLKEDWGSFSDIGHLSPVCDRASVNISCGYYNQHTLNEYVVFEEMENTYKVVCAMLRDAQFVEEPYDYQEECWNYTNRYYMRGYNWDKYFRNYYNDEEDDNTYLPKQKEEPKEEEPEVYKFGWEFLYKDEDGQDAYDVVVGNTFEDAVGRFMMQNPGVCWNDIIDYFATELV